jgi:predicted RNase H-like nuclease (RuvC/YqgF family)
VIKKRTPGGPAAVSGEDSATKLAIKKLERLRDTLETENSKLNEELEEVKAKHFNLEYKMEKMLLK